MNAPKLKKSACVLHPTFGPLYIIGHFRDGGGTVWEGINGKDGVSYQFYASEVTRVISRDEFDTQLGKANG